MLNYFIIFTAALISGVIFTFLLARVSCRYKILRIKNIPLVGGIGVGLAFIFSFLSSVFIFGFPGTEIIALIIAALFMLFFGFLDDLVELSVIQKFLAESFCAVILISFGVKTDIMYFGFWGNALVTFFWILGITNAFNMLDIRDGLASGVALIVGSAFLWLGFLSGNLNVQILSLILCACSFGFILFNFPPAKVYLGNSGSHFFGLLFAGLALITHYASQDNVFALLSPVMILGLPIVDTVILVIFRMIKRKPPFNKSTDHIALRMGALGFSPLKTILIMYLLCLIFASCGVVLTRVSSLLAAGIILSVFFFSVGIFLKLLKIELND